MENEVNVKKAFNETYIILNELKLYNKIPDELKSLIEINRDDKYEFHFNKNVPLFNQVDNQTTRNLITYIFINYINSNNKNNVFLKKEIDDILNSDSSI